MDFQANYEELSTVGRSLVSKASEYNNEISSIYAKIEEVSNGWQGADNQAFANQVNSYKQPMEELGKAIEESGEFLVKVASVIEETQNQVSEAAGRI